MDYKKLRERMVQEQLVARGIHNQRVINAFLRVERHLFVPESLQKNAYEDFPMPIGEGQTISQPYIVALMTECLALEGKEKILEIGTGCGYQTAILLELTQGVYTVERIGALAEKAQQNLLKLGYNNFKIKVGDGTLGWQEEAPFDGILIAAAASKVPLPLAEQLKEGGKMVLPLGESFSQTLTLAERKNNKTQLTEICGCVFVPLIGKFGQGAIN